MPASGTSPTISIIVEWENAILAADELGLAMLKRLAEESRSLDNVKEIRFVFDPTIVDVSALKSLVAETISAKNYGNQTIDIAYQPVEGAHYYEFKNAGTAAAGTDIVAFLDSDVLPDPGWLKELTAPLFDGHYIAAAGTSHIRPGSTFDAAFAAGWFFPLPADIGTKKHTHYFFANNVAFKRSFLVQNPFPAMPQGVTRGACSQLADQMAKGHQLISYRPTARVWHPPPNGLSHFVTRALAQGRDDVYRYRRWVPRIVQVGIALIKSLLVPVRTAFRIARNRRQLRAKPFAPLSGAAVMFAYSIMQFIGSVLALTAPGIARRHWKI